MDEIRWFAPNRFGTLVVPRLRDLGLAIALEGDRPARLALAMDAQVAGVAYAYAARRRVPLLHYLWDLPPWCIGRGRPDWVWYLWGRYLRLPRLGRRYPERPGYYSRLRFVATRARAVWVPSAATAASVWEHFGLACRQVPFCYDSERFTGASAPAPSPVARPASLLSVSRLTPQKNHRAVIAAAARFEPKLAVRIIGDGPERGALERLAADLDVPCAIARGLSEADMVDAYRSAGVVVCPSRFEGFGLTPLEAIACGTPVVASDIPPHREFLGTAPHYFAVDDGEGLVRAIAAARRSPPPSPTVLADLTIEAAAQRFLAGLTPHLG
ncbi:MAG TPA: glycosyltransferase [Gemmatimonadales bacterium]|nr:glycosyltransferase [Gemmatimonadales bacterium]